MSRITTVATVIACLALTAGCGGSKSSPTAAAPSTTTPAAAPTTSAPTTSAPATPAQPVVNRFAGQSAVQIWKKSRKLSDAASSVHVTAYVKDAGEGLQLDLHVADKKATGTIKVKGGKLTIRRIGTTLYYKADSKFYRSGGLKSSQAQMMDGVWIKSKNGASGQFKDFYTLTNMQSLVHDSLALQSSEQRALKRVSGKTINGQPTVGLYDPAPGLSSDQSGTLYIAATGAALPVELRPKDQKQYLRFQDWNKPFAAAAPAGAMTIPT